MISSSLPRRCCLCLLCRTALFPGQGCDCSEESEVACFAEKSEREKIVSAAWGHEDRRAASVRILERARNRIASASLGGLTAGLAVSEALWGFGPGMAVCGIFGGLIGGVVVRYHGASGELQPFGGAAPQPATGPGFRASLSGVHDLISPATANACLGYCIELRLLQGRSEWVMYRDAVTCGFVAELGTGEKIVVPAGRLHFGGQAPEILDVDNLELEAYLEGVDPCQVDSDLFRPLHFNLVREEVLFSGDQVDISGDFRPTLVDREEADYRETLATYLQSEGIPEVRLLR